MDSLLNNQLATMVPSPIKNQYFNDVFANISQPQEVKKLRLDSERKKLEKGLESVEHGSNAENVGKTYTTPDKRQNLQHDGEDVRRSMYICCMPGPPLDASGCSECISREKIHHACMLKRVEQ